MSLADNITYYDLSPRIIEQWNNLKKILLDNHKDQMTIQEIQPSDIERFKSDFFGLLKHKFKIDEKFWYPHLIINEMKTPLEFTESMVTIKILQTNILSNYLEFIEE